MVGLGLLVIDTARNGAWGPFLPAAILGLPIGAMAGCLDALPGLLLLALLGPRFRRHRGSASVVVGLVAAAVPLAITFRAGLPAAPAATWTGLGLAGAAFLAAVICGPVVLRDVADQPGLM